jgi:hypothetical protein
VELSGLAEPVRLRARVAREPDAVRAEIASGKFIVTPLWKAWGPALAAQGLDRAALSGILRGYGYEVWLWAVGERTWAQSLEGLAGRVSRRVGARAPTRATKSRRVTKAAKAAKARPPTTATKAEAATKARKAAKARPPTKATKARPATKAGRTTTAKKPPPVSKSARASKTSKAARTTKATKSAKATRTTKASKTSKATKTSRTTKARRPAGPARKTRRR